MAVVVLQLSESEVSDLLFFGRLGRFLSVAPTTGHRVIVIHDGFYEARAIIENDGYDFGQLTREAWENSAERVHASVKGLTRRIVNGLTDEGVPSVGMQCAERNLIVKSEGKLLCGEPEKMIGLTANGVIPVFGPIVQIEGGGTALESAELLSWFVAAMTAGSGIGAAVRFSSPNSSIDLKSIKSVTYPKLGRKVISEQIDVETLADTEFWERFS